MPMTLSMIHGGLCLTCREAEGCEVRNGRNGSVLQCELYEGRQAWLRDPVALELTAPRDSAFAHAKKNGELVGLCVTCHDREVCGYAHRPGGVWQCEQYR